jgi:PAS domain S-box-containing protein
MKILKNYIRTIQKWIEAIDFGDPTRNRIGAYLQGICLITIVAGIAIAINYLFQAESLVVLGLIFIGVIIYIGILLVIRRGHLRAGSILFVGVMLVLLLIGTFSKNGMHGAGALMYPVLIIFSSLLLSRKQFIVFTGLVLISVGSLIYAERQGALLQFQFDPPSFTLFTTYALIIIFTAIVVRYVTEEWQNSLERSQEIQKELQKQKALLEISEARWRSLVLNAPVIIANIGREGQIKFVNVDDTGISSANRERTIFNFMNEKYHAIAHARLEKCFDTGQPDQFEMEAPGANSETAWYNVAFGPVMENEKVIDVILIATDITRQKQAEAEIRTLNEELDQRVRDYTMETEAAYRELEMFSYAISHNLRTPARGMTGFAEMLLRDYENQLDASARNFLRRISQNAITMGLMIDDLLDFLQLGRVPLKVQDVSPTKLAQTALESLPSYRDNLDISITIDPMPRVKADAELLIRVYANLIDNAIKFTRGTRSAAIHIGTMDTDKGLTFFVKDNGIGFDMQYIGKLFGVFQQLHRPGEYEGTGVGLATVQRIIRRHSGHIWAEAELNKGATFFFTL